MLAADCTLIVESLCITTRGDVVNDGLENKVGSVINLVFGNSEFEQQIRIKCPEGGGCW